MIKKTQKIVLWMTLIFSGVYAIAFAEIVDRIVAVVNNDIITLTQLNKAIQPYLQNIDASQNSAEQKKQLIQKLENDMLVQLVDRALTTQEAVKYNIEVAEKDVDAAVNNFKEQNRLDQEGLEKALVAEGLNYKEYRERLKGEILQSLLINRAVRSQVIITESDIQAYHDTHGKAFVEVKKYHLRNIFMSNEAELKEVEKKIGKELSFAQLAKQYSLATNAEEGGDLGTFDINNFSENIKLGLQALGKGDHTPVLAVGQGYQIIYVEDILVEDNKTIDQTRDQIQNILYKEQAEKRFAEWIDALKKNAHIKIML
ncbi:MAG: SurA N-terminal domain-containing protein [Proteobacteria bacterium]|nr:parvulin peptidyl-prolyl isomerase [Desulfobacula sp.]MBU3952788.1 SurA N-terminal domain-containing protein [Pseudomonadota bacterium]MBU4130659.1 SurA N-terminal domain-containing protein [Pseudomonadota bacterium]